VSRVSLPLAACAALVAGCAREHDVRTIVLVSLDTVRADHLGCYGNARVRTPALDALAADGVRFDQAMTAAPTTLASHLSIFTGTYPHTHGAARNGFTVAPENVTLAELLRDAGWRTAAFLGSFALDRRFGIDQGFEHYDQRFDVGVDGTHEQAQRRAGAVTDAALAWLDRERPGDSFLFVHYFDAHAPYEPPAPFDALYARPGGPQRSTLADVDVAVRAQQRRATGRELGAEAVIRGGLSREHVERADGVAEPADLDLAALYAGEVSYVDRELGRLLEGLRARGRLEKALVVVLADHGETFAEHGDVWNHGLWVYETTVRVPLLVRTYGEGQHALAPRVVTEPVSTIDVLPSVCALLGVEPPRAVEGVSLVPWMRGEERAGTESARGPIYCEATQPPSVEGGAWANDRKPKCVRSGTCKLVHAPYLELTQLFDLAADPGERSNLHGKANGCDAPSLERELGSWRAAAKPLPSRFDPSQTLETLRRLRELGYSEGDPQGDGRR
jgi:arylsulfatase A-like enzyme